MIETSALISFGTWITAKLAEKGFEYVYKSTFSSPEDINSKFYEAVERTSLRLQKKYPDLLGNSVEYFFKRELVFNELIKLLFNDSKINLQIIKSHFDSASLPKKFLLEFISTLKEEVLKDEQLGAILRNNQIFLLLQGLSIDLTTLAQNSTLSLVELKNIRKAIENQILEQFSFEEFERSYRENALRVLSQVNFIGLGVDISIKRKTKILEDIFVKPLFTIHKRNKAVGKPIIDDSDEQLDQIQITYKKLFDVNKRIVVLGNPGSGKSVLIKSLICDILNDKDPEFDNKELLSCLPFRIELRKYLAYKKSNRGNIIKYLVSSLEEEYGIRNLTESIVDGIIQRNPTIFFFDGLDEIFKIRDKIEIRNDIENFHSVYSEIWSLTSSRIIGYDEASLDENRFFELRILNFNKSQIEEYVRKWYTKEEEDVEIRLKEVERFLNLKEEIDVELIRNPLLLSLIVIIYRNILKIPESKLEIYQSCTKTLVDKWDAEKDLQIDLDPRIYRDKEKIFSDLAYWQYRQLSSENIQLSYEKAKATIAKTLRNKLEISDDFELEELSESFMNYAEKRSIYFDNNFTHKTFLEYYTAYWIYSNVEKKHKSTERDKIISNYILNPFWFIVLELLLNMIDKDQADSEIIDEIISYQLDNDIKSCSFFLIVIPTLKNISQNQIKKVFNCSIEYLLKNQKEIRRSHSDSLMRIFYQLQRLYDSVTFKELINEEIQRFELIKKYSSLVYSFYMELRMYGFARNTSLDSFDLKDSAAFRKQVHSDSLLFRLNWYSTETSSEDVYFEFINQYIDLFGFSKVYKMEKAKFGSFAFGPVINNYLNYQTKPSHILNLSKNIEFLESKGLKKKELLNYIMRNGHFFFDNDHLLAITRSFDKEDKNFEAIMLLGLLIRSVGNHYRDFERSITIEECAAICVNRKDLLLEIGSEKKIEKRIELAYKHFPVEDL